MVAVEEDARLPLPDAHFDLVINRHESFDPHEVRRILRPGGLFLTQQVGGQDNVELNQALQETVTLSYGAWDAAEAARQLRDAGLEVLDEREAFSPGRFVDIGAVVMYLRITPWQIDGFDVAALPRAATDAPSPHAGRGWAGDPRSPLLRRGAAAGGLTQHLRVHSPQHRTVCYDADIITAAPAFP